MSRPQLSGRDLLLARSAEAPWQDNVFNLAARGGFHGFHIRVSHASLEGLHSPQRMLPRGADHDDASGIPDLVLVHPERHLLLLPELKRQGGRVSPDQARWLEWLSRVETVWAGVWTPSQEREVREVLLGGRVK